MKIAVKINSIILALFPALAVYLVLPGTTLAFFLSLLLLVFFIIKFPKFSFSQRGSELAWFCFILILGFLGCVANLNESWFSVSLFINNLYAIILTFLVILVSTHYVSISIFIKANLFFGILTAIVCILQRISIAVTGTTYINLFIPGLNLIRDINTFTLSRPSAFFTEPAHLAIYLLPIAYYLLMARRFILFALISVAILASGSSTGFILLILICLYYLLTIKIKFIYIFYFIIGVSLSLFLISMYAPDVIIDNVSKISNSDASTNVRLLGAMNYISLFEFKNHIIGVGLNQLADFLYAHGVFPDDNPNYANAFLYMFISYGIIGLLSFIVYLYKLWGKARQCRGFILILLGVIFSDQILFNQNLVYLVTFVLLSEEINKYIVAKN